MWGSLGYTHSSTVLGKNTTLLQGSPSLLSFPPNICLANAHKEFSFSKPPVILYSLCPIHFKLVVFLLKQFSQEPCRFLTNFRRSHAITPKYHIIVISDNKKKPLVKTSGHMKWPYQSSGFIKKLLKLFPTRTMNLKLRHEWKHSFTAAYHYLCRKRGELKGEQSYRV